MMKKSEVIASRLGDFRGEYFDHPINFETTYAGLEDALKEYSKLRLVISRSDSHLLGLSEDFIETLFLGGPSWIHLNGIVVKGSVVLITMRRGALIGTPTPSLNVSFSVFDNIEVNDENILIERV